MGMVLGTGLIPIALMAYTQLTKIMEEQNEHTKSKNFKHGVDTLSQFDQHPNILCKH